LSGVGIYDNWRLDCIYHTLTFYAPSSPVLWNSRVHHTKVALARCNEAGIDGVLEVVDVGALSLGYRTGGISGAYF